MIAFEVVRRSGYETLHNAFSKYASLVDQQVVIDTLGKWGATHQSAFERFYTIEIILALPKSYGPCRVRLCRPMCGGGYAPRTAARLFPGYAPGPGLALRIFIGPKAA